MRRTSHAARIAYATGLALALAAGAGTAFADDHGRGRERTNVIALPAYAKECSACHVAYAPGLLPAPSWQRVMERLPRHYGTDASLDAATTRQIAVWLQANAATGKRAAEPPEDRITRSAWFQHEHREIEPAVWKRPAVGGAANCSACHRSADIGRFSEHDVNIPR